MVVVGRDVELGRLRDALTSLSAGRGGAVLLEGEPGIGKSALVDAMVAAARDDGVEVLRAEPDEGGGSGTYDRLLDVSRAVTGGLFFVPPAPMLESMGDDDDEPDNEAADPEPPAAEPAPPAAGSLNIGSLRGASHDE